MKTLKAKAQEYFPQEYKKNGINILSVGRLTEQKGFDISIEAAKILKKENVNFKWVVLGDGELREELEKQINDDIKDNFLLIGKRNNPYPYFEHCDFVVQSSRYEGKSIVLDEAKIFSKPIICANYNTAKDQITHGENGIIVPLEDPIALAKTIIDLNNDVKLKEKIIDNLNKEKFVDVKDYEQLFLNKEN